MVQKKVINWYDHICSSAWTLVLELGAFLFLNDSQISVK